LIRRKYGNRFKKIANGSIAANNICLVMIFIQRKLSGNGGSVNIVREKSVVQISIGMSRGYLIDK
jgi:hypothetical protein